MTGRIYMGLSAWMFAAFYDFLNSVVEERVKPYRIKTAGKAWGEVIEIGGGTGANLAYYNRDVQLTVSEPNPHMISRLSKHAETLGPRPKIISDPGEDLPFDNDSFDCVVTTLVLCMVKDYESVIKEVRRIIRPGGHFLFYEHVISQNAGMRRFQRYLNPAWRFCTTGCNLDRDIGGAVQNAGFEKVEMKSFDLSVGLPLRIPNIVGIATA